MSEFDTQLDKYVTFKSGNEYFALKIEYVNEIPETISGKIRRVEIRDNDKNE